MAAARRRTGEPPKYNHHRASGQAYSTHNYVITYHGKYGSPESHRRYPEYILQWQQNQENEPERPRGTILIGELTERFLCYARSHYVRVDGTLTPEVGAFVTAFKPLLAQFRHVPAEEFRARDLKVIQAGWRRKGHTRHTINKNIGRIVRAFKWAVGEELIRPDVHALLAAVPTIADGEAVTPD